MKLKQLLTAAAMITASFTAPTTFADPFTDAADTVQYRQHAFSLIRANFGVMASMVRGETKYDAALFQQHANAVKNLSKVPIDGFRGVGQNATADSAALPVIWQKWDDFESKMNNLIAAAEALAEAAESGSIRKIRPKFVATAGTCKQCHDNYKAD